VTLTAPCNGTFRVPFTNADYVMCDGCGATLPWNDPRAILAFGRHARLPHLELSARILTPDQIARQVTTA
jgi:hypothetical protein